MCIGFRIFFFFQTFSMHRNPAHWQKQFFRKPGSHVAFCIGTAYWIFTIRKFEKASMFANATIYRKNRRSFWRRFLLTILVFRGFQIRRSHVVRCFLWRFFDSRLRSVTVSIWRYGDDLCSRQS